MSVLIGWDDVPCQCWLAEVMCHASADWLICDLMDWWESNLRLNESKTLGLNSSSFEFLNNEKEVIIGGLNSCSQELEWPQKKKDGWFGNYPLTIWLSPDFFCCRHVHLNHQTAVCVYRHQSEQAFLRGVISQTVAHCRLSVNCPQTEVCHSLAEDWLQLTKRQTRQINWLRTSVTFTDLMILKVHLWVGDNWPSKGRHSEKERSSWMSLLITLIDPSVGSHPVPRRRCAREVFGPTFYGSRVLQGKAGRPDVCKAIDSRVALIQGPSHGSTVLASVVPWQSSAKHFVATPAVIIPWYYFPEMRTKAARINKSVNWVWKIELQ